MAGCNDRAQVFAALRQSLSRLVPYDLMAVYLCRGDRLIPESVDGEAYRLFASIEIPIGMGLSGWVAENRKSSINGNPAVEPGYMIDPARFSSSAVRDCHTAGIAGTDGRRTVSLSHGARCVQPRGS